MNELAITVEVGTFGLMVAMQDEPAETQALWLSVYGVGTTVGIMLPFSRTQESEADHLGLIFMAWKVMIHTLHLIFGKEWLLENKGDRHQNL